MLAIRRHSTDTGHGDAPIHKHSDSTDLIKIMWRQKAKLIPLASLPNEVWFHIFSYLDVQTLLVTALVCRTWASISDMKTLWTIDRVKPTLIKVLGAHITDQLLSNYNKDCYRPKDIHHQAVNQVKDGMISTLTQLHFYFRYTWSHKFYKYDAIINRLAVMEKQIRLTSKEGGKTQLKHPDIHQVYSPPATKNFLNTDWNQARRSSMPIINTTYLFSPRPTALPSPYPLNLIKPMTPRVFWTAHSMLNHLSALLENSDKIFEEQPTNNNFEYHHYDNGVNNVQNRAAASGQNTPDSLKDNIENFVKDVKTILALDRSVIVESWLSVFQLLAHQMPTRINSCLPLSLSEVVMKCCAEEWIRIDDFLEVVNDRYRLTESRVCYRHQDFISRFISQTFKTEENTKNSNGKPKGVLSVFSNFTSNATNKNRNQLNLVCDHCQKRKPAGFVPICRGDDTGASHELNISLGGMTDSPKKYCVAGEGEKFVVYYFCNECRENGVCENCHTKIFAWETSLRGSGPDFMECKCGKKIIPKAHISSLSVRTEPDRHINGNKSKKNVVDAPVIMINDDSDVKSESSQTEEEYLSAIRKAYQEDVERCHTTPILSSCDNNFIEDIMFESPPNDDEDTDNFDLDDDNDSYED
eukprot:TRINITY_DN261_c0_g1_i1.p1 TRINITY_DN261_c0_g1~~TRINITY_DN261_c0_g1_i1.p1  ORF type:complete len:639 (-),score=91.75 TRINITY_DN261_c0_g1_i1:182-2098(-)